MDFEENASNEDASEQLFALLLESGAIELVGVADGGEPTYRVTEKCRDIFPEFYEFHLQSMNNTANELWQLGVIEMSFTAQGESVKFTTQNYARLKEVIDDLNDEQIKFLEALGAPIKRNR